MSSKQSENFVVREIQLKDLSRGFFDTLTNLAPIGNLTSQHERAKMILSEIRSYPFYNIFVAVREDGELIGSITILIEQKFIHGGAKVGHIEDVVTRSEHEGRGVGKALVLKALDFAKQKNVTKWSLIAQKGTLNFTRN